MSLLGDFKKALGGLVQQAAGAPMPTINQMLDINVLYLKQAADGAAGTATADLVVWVNPYDFPVYVIGASISPTAAVTADNTNFATITFKTNNGAGAATAIAATMNTTITEVGATLPINQSKAFATITAANIAIPAGGELWFNIAKSGAGVVIPISNFVLRLQKAE